MLYFESRYLNIDWDEQMKAVIMKWKGFVTGETFQALNPSVLLLSKMPRLG